MAKMTQAQMEARIAELEAAVAVKQGDLTIGMTDSGCIRLGGVRGKWGATYYANEWERILSKSAEILAFAKENAVELHNRSEATRARKAAEKAAKVA